MLRSVAGGLEARVGPCPSNQSISASVAVELVVACGSADEIGSAPAEYAVVASLPDDHVGLGRSLKEVGVFGANNGAPLARTGRCGGRLGPRRLAQYSGDQGEGDQGSGELSSLPRSPHVAPFPQQVRNPWCADSEAPEVLGVSFRTGIDASEEAL